MTERLKVCLAPRSCETRLLHAAYWLGALAGDDLGGSRRLRVRSRRSTSLALRVRTAWMSRMEKQFSARTADDL